MNKTILILSGIPCSGKSTYAKSKTHDYVGYPYFNVISLSRDDIRLDIFGVNYYPSSIKEERITDLFNFKLNNYLLDSSIDLIILDNTFCKEKYIDEIISKYGKNYKLFIKFFDISLFKAHIRNIFRYFINKKWIPIKIMNQMYKNYNKINRKKYSKLIFH